LNKLWSFQSSSFWWSSAFDDLQNLWWRQLLVYSFWGGCFWWRQLLMIFRTFVFRTSFLQTLPCNSSFLFVDSIALICSSRTYAWIIDTKFLSMVLHTWTNISISDWHFLIPCYHQNSKGNVKHILFHHLRVGLPLQR
jgi:hypothetical protein